MAKNDNLTDFLTDVADAIRTKKGVTRKINPQDFAWEISNISTGGGDTPTPTPTPDMPVIGDGKTYLYIKIAEKGRMEVPLYFSQTVANGVTIDWGDGSATQTLSGTGKKNTTHTYADVGEYTISLNPSSGCTLGLGRDSASYCVMGSTGNNGRVYCNMLQAVEIGKNITSIDNYAFQKCSSLASVVIPQGVTRIGDSAFYSCYPLASVVIPQGVTSISRNAFFYCYSLASIVIPDSVTSIGDSAFSYCRSLASIVIPQGVTSIGGGTFFYCSALASIVIPDSVTSIGDNAFNQCYSLANVVIPDGVTSIGDSTFFYCSALASIVIPDSVTSIGDSAFNQCCSLASVVIPNSVTSIGNYAFNQCYGMAYYDFRASKSVPTLSNTNAFSSIPSDCKIVVPDDLYDSWIVATYWSTCANNIIKASEFNG